MLYVVFCVMGVMQWLLFNVSDQCWETSKHLCHQGAATVAYISISISDIVQTFTGTRAWRKSALFVSGGVTLAALCSECVYVSLCGPHRGDSPRKGDGTVASGETDRRSVQEGVKGGREGKDGEEGGECLNMQPLWVDGQWHPKHFLPLPPSKGTCC